MTLFRSPFRVLVLTILAACGQAENGPDSSGVPEVARLDHSGPPGAPSGTCWGKTVKPAIIETRTEQRLLEPAKYSDAGTVIQPARYKTESQQVIVSERQHSWFEAPCDNVLTVEFISSLQRALAVRNLYGGPITGEMDARTATAIRRFQQVDGPRSGVLALSSARKLGLIAIEREAE